MSETEASHSPAINTIMFADANRGRALFTHSFYKTVDGGKEWTKGLDVYGDFYHDFTFVTDDDGWMVGTRTNKYESPYDPLILHTTDGGATWQEQKINQPQSSISLPQPLTSVSFCGSNVGWAAGVNMIVHTTNGGASWEIQHLGKNSENLQSVICVSPDQAWAVGNNGLILYTNDGGRNWITQEISTGKILLRVRFFDNNLWVVGRDGTLLQMKSGDMKWIKHRTDSVEALYDIYFTGPAGWIVGNNGTILRTVDGGATWKKHTSPTENDLRSLHFINPQNGWAGGEYRTLLHFSD